MKMLLIGYTDEFLKEAEQIDMRIPFDMFGWFYGRNGSSTDGFFTVRIGSDDVTQFGRLV